MIRVALGLSFWSLVLKGSEPFAGLSLGGLVHMDVLEEPFAAIAFVVVDGVAFVHLFRKRWNVFHSMEKGGGALRS